ncbi:MAG: hypothetical protein VX427_02260 [Acidobacteriota bacterium]|nr:hypothetical protein [Acidobacteriota bacterium]
MYRSGPFGSIGVPTDPVVPAGETANAMAWIPATGELARRQ